MGAEGTLALTTDPDLAALHAAGLIRPVFVSPTAQLAGRHDYYTPTDAGLAWLTRHGTES